MTINEIQDEIIEEFEAFDDWMERYQLIVEYANELKKHPMPVADKNDRNKIDGCQSTVWFTAKMEGDKLVYNGDSDALLVKGIVALLLHVVGHGEYLRAVGGVDVHLDGGCAVGGVLEELLRVVVHGRVLHVVHHHQLGGGLVTLGDDATIETAMAADLGFSYGGKNYWRTGAELTLVLPDLPTNWIPMRTSASTAGSRHRLSSRTASSAGCPRSRCC